MTAEQTQGICPTHNCPKHACPADCTYTPESGDATEPTVENEIRYFTKEEVIEQFTIVAEINGTNIDDLEPEENGERYNSEGQLVIFNMKLKPEKAAEKKSGNIWYMFMAKRPGHFDPTSIMVAYSKIATPDDVYFAETPLTYSDTQKEWVRDSDFFQE